MDTRIHTITITVHDREAVYKKVGELLHQYAPQISLRVGYPLPDKNIAIIFIIIELTNDELGALSGKLGQLPSVKVKSSSRKL
jgi:putative iron-only hydrogenase system regulator